MRKILGFITLVILCLYPYSARADTSLPIPDVKGWTIVNISRIEIRVSDDIVAYLGFSVEYLNPADSREFVRIVSGHTPLIITKHRPKDEHLFREAAAEFYSQKEETDRLSEVSKKSDPIMYVRWRTKSNPRTRNDMLDGDVSIWFMPAEGLNSDGSWPFFKNKKIEIEFLSENVANLPMQKGDKSHNVFTGMKYRVGDVYYIFRVNRDDLIRLFQKGGK